MCAQVLQVVLSIRQLSPRLEFFRTQAAAAEIPPVSPSIKPFPRHAERVSYSGLCAITQPSGFRGQDPLLMKKSIKKRWELRFESDWEHDICNRVPAVLRMLGERGCQRRRSWHRSWQKLARVTTPCQNKRSCNHSTTSLLRPSRRWLPSMWSCGNAAQRPWSFTEPSALSASGACIR